MIPWKAALILFTLLPGCSGITFNYGPEGEEEDGKPGTPPAASLPLEAAELSVAAAQERLAVAEGEAALQESANLLAVESARSEARQAQMRLAILDDIDAKRRTEEAGLAVQSARDGIEDAVDELDQLKKMYGENELADATKEIVVKRGERQVARARTGLAIQEMNASKAAGEVRAEREKLSQEFLQKRKELEQAEAKAKIQTQQKRAALLEAQAALKKTQDERDQLQKKTGKTGS